MSDNGDAILRLPKELRELPQWCVAGKDKAPYVADQSGSLYHASPIQGPWLTFDDACNLAKKYNVGVGFILTENDPYTCIDLDVKETDDKITTQEELDRYSQIVTAFNSYTELSTSGKGVHIWVRGDIGKGARRQGVEIYSKERFIICTGNTIGQITYKCEDNAITHVVNAITLPIRENNYLLELLVSELRSETSSTIELVEIEETSRDNEIINKLLDAANSTKFTELCKGEWKKYSYPSQSEADLALMSMFAFYSKSNEQCKRLFRMTELGKRAKAIKNDTYLNYTLKVIRGREVREEKLIAAVKEQTQNLILPGKEVFTGDMTVIEDMESSFTCPPGVMGEVAKYIYRTAPRPVMEIATVAAIGLISGIAGRAYNIPQSGLNTYMILIARSGTGKEALMSGPALIIDRLRNAVPAIQEFVDFNEFASGQALIKACCNGRSSFVNINDEWGQRLREFADNRATAAQRSLRTVMTTLYQKSGSNSIAGGINYSNKDNNIEAVSGVSYSLVGNSTPGTFYECLTESMMEDGFLSRFTIVEYTGQRVDSNLGADLTMDINLVDFLQKFVEHTVRLLDRPNNPQMVAFEPNAQMLMNNFDKKCDAEINRSNDEGWRQMWNRAHLKALRIAALLGVIDNFLNPVVSLNHAEWAIKLIENDIRSMSRRYMEGDVGNSDATREKKVISIISEYLNDPGPPGYGIPDVLKKDRIIPRRYLQTRIQRSPSFTQCKGGTSFVLDNCLRSLVDSGYIIEADRAEVIDKYGAQGKCYRILRYMQI